MKKHGMGTALLSVILCVLMAGCAAAIKDAPIAMLDLRTNSGGGTGIGDSWIQEYCGQPLRGNLLNFSDRKSVV